MEIGQMIFGNPVGAYETDDVVDALLHFIMDEFRRVYQNVNQKDWYNDPTLVTATFPELEVRPYYWGDDETEAAKPNLAYGEVEVRWYKHFGRSMTVNVDWNILEWVDWFEEVLAYIRAADKI